MNSTLTPSDPCPVSMRGIVPSFNVPFDLHGGLDIAAMQLQTRIALEAGCAGLLINAVAGETGSLTSREKQQVLETVLDTVAGRVPVIAGVSQENRTDRIALARMARQAGAPWMLCQPPAGLRGASLQELMEELVDVGPPNLMVQDLDWSGPGLPLEEILLLFERIPAFRALKIETIPSGPKYSQVLKATGGRLHVSGGWAVLQMMEALRRGVHAFIPSTMETLYCRIYRDFQAGEEELARALFENMLPVLAFSNTHIHVALRFFKKLRVREGIFANDAVRPPVPPLDAWQSQEAERQIARVLRLKTEVER